MHQFQKALLTLLLSALAATVAVTAKAQIICNNWGSGGSTGQCIYDCNFSNGSYGGSYGTSYDCYSHNNYCTINFTGGNSYQGPSALFLPAITAHPTTAMSTTGTVKNPSSAIISHQIATGFMCVQVALLSPSHPRGWQAPFCSYR